MATDLQWENKQLAKGVKQLQNNNNQLLKLHDPERQRACLRRRTRRYGPATRGAVRVGDASSYGRAWQSTAAATSKFRDWGFTFADENMASHDRIVAYI